MPIRHAIWKVGTKPESLKEVPLPREQLLEDMIVADPAILSEDWMLIGRQEDTGLGGRVDLLAIAPDGSLVVIELKRSRTPRDVLAQAIDYASWVEKLTAEQIARIFQRFSKGKDLGSEFKARFGNALEEDSLNENHQVVVVAASLDEGTERILQYLNARDIAINALFFQVFQHGDALLLSRAWLIDPSETQLNVVAAPRTHGPREPWNGEFYISFGQGDDRNWEEASKYGFISAGGGPWYSNTLNILKPGDRVWVNIPGTGYVGVGRVTGERVPLAEFKIPQNGTDRPAVEVLKVNASMRERLSDPERTEYYVPVTWQQTVPLNQAVKETGFFGNQNSACKPVTPSWRTTVERLKTKFPKWEDAERSGTQKKDCDNLHDLTNAIRHHVDETADRFRNLQRQGYFTHPIPFFGNPENATVVTVGLNPSSTEFAPDRCWPHALSTGELLDRCIRYHNLPATPPHAWFSPWSEALAAIGCSYSDGSAVHLDLSPRPTRSLSDLKEPEETQQFLAMIELDVQFFFRALACCRNARLIMVAGTASKQYYINEFLRLVASRSGYSLEPAFVRDPGKGKTAYQTLSTPTRRLPVFFCSSSPSDLDKTMLPLRVRENSERIKGYLSDAAFKAE